MKEGFFLLSYSVNGIKSIKNEVKLDFYKKTIDKNPNFSKYNVKAIYGENGTGKSAIITSVKVLKNLVINAYYLKDSSNIDVLNNLVNVDTKRFSIEVCFFSNIKYHFIHKYSINVFFDENEKHYKIQSECLSERSINGKKWHIIYKIVDGSLTESCSNITFNKINVENGKNTLIEQTFASYFVSKMPGILDKNKTEKDSKMIFGLVILFLFMSNIFVYMEDSDNYKNRVSLDQIIKYIEDRKDMEIFPKKRSIIEEIMIDREGILKKTDIEQFKHSLEGMTEFIKLFKPSLKNVDANLKENKELYNYELEFDYCSYKINSLYESNGIKKLIRLYKAIEAINNGEIVFIDEFDSNIHDVYLCKLIEYICNYTDGQLCFTSQSLMPMTVLANRKKSIDFLSRDGSIVSWVKNSHYKPLNQYYDGMIENSPFNIDDFDFIKVFGDNNEE